MHQPTPPRQWFNPTIPSQQLVHAMTLPELFTTMSLIDLSHNGWYIDTGATCHLHSKAGILKTKSNCIFYPSVLVGDGSKIFVKSMGDAYVSYFNSYRTISLKIYYYY